MTQRRRTDSDVQAVIETADGARGSDDDARGSDETGHPPSVRHRRRRRAVLVGAGSMIAVAVVAAGAMGLGGGGADEAGSAPPRTGTTVQVTRATLTDAATVDGELNHGPEIPLGVKSGGTVTWLPAGGKTVRRGQALLRVDDRPVVLLYGRLPMYRALTGPGRGAHPATPKASDSADAATADRATADAATADRATADAAAAAKTDVRTAPSGTPRSPGSTPAPRNTLTSSPAAAAAPVKGRDIRQFESNLRALGYSGFPVDETYTAATAAAVKRWQKDLGVPMTGAVGAGDVFYASGPVRISRALVRLGAEATGDVLSYTGTTRMVTVEAPVSGVGWAEHGVRVSVNLPDGRSVPGKVTSVGSEATPSQEQDAAAASGGDQAPDTSGGGGGGGGGGADSQNPMVPVVIDIPDQNKLGRLQRSPVTIEHVVRKREDVLTVPVSALVALAEGGYGLEVVEGRSSHYVTVQTGLFADGRVEVSGAAVRAGMTVRIPQ